LAACFYLARVGGVKHGAVAGALRAGGRADIVAG
jgi:hypothetical protein